LASASAGIFAIEALGFFDHYNFLGRMAKPKKPAAKKGAPAKKVSLVEGPTSRRRG
jgi:hypothetical protein